MIVHQRGHEQVGQPDLSRFAEIIEQVLGHRVGQRRALFAPIGDELVEPDGVDHRAGKDMGADLRPLFQNDDGDLLVLFGGELLEPNRSGQTRRPPAHDHHIELHHVPFDLIAHLSPFCSCRAPSRAQLFPRPWQIWC